MKGMIAIMDLDLNGIVMYVCFAFMAVFYCYIFVATAIQYGKRFRKLRNRDARYSCNGGS